MKSIFYLILRISLFNSSDISLSSGVIPNILDHMLDINHVDSSIWNGELNFILLRFSCFIGLVDLFYICAKLSFIGNILNYIIIRAIICPLDLGNLPT